MQNPSDFPKLKSSSDKTYTKLELFLQASQMTTVDWFDLREAIAANTTIHEVHLRVEKEFAETFPMGQLLELCQAIGKLKQLKWLFVGQMSGPVTVFSQLPISALTAMLTSAGDKLLWWYVRGCIITHVYKGSDEEKEDKSGVLDVSQHREKRTSGKEKKKKDSKDKKKKKDKKKSSKKDGTKSSMDISEKQNPATVAKVTPEDKLNQKQSAAKRALEKLGDSIITLKKLKKISIMGHFDEVMQGCQMDPIMEGLSALEELELVVVAITRHDGRILVDPSALGSFFEASHPKLKECSLLYMSLTDDHVEEMAGALSKHTAPHELTLQGDGKASGETIGQLFRGTAIQKFLFQEFVMNTSSVVAMCIAMAHVYTLQELELSCPLLSIELLALQQMIIANQGLETLHLHLTAVDNESAPLDLVTSLLSNPKSKLSTIKFEASDKSEDTKVFRDTNVDDWKDVTDGIFKVEISHTIDTHIITFTKL